MIGAIVTLMANRASCTYLNFCNREASKSLFIIKKFSANCQASFLRGKAKSITVSNVKVLISSSALETRASVAYRLTRSLTIITWVVIALSFFFKIYEDFSNHPLKASMAKLLNDSSNSQPAKPFWVLERLRTRLNQVNLSLPGWHFSR